MPPTPPWLCYYERRPCWRRGQAEAGPVTGEPDGGTRQRVTCLTCGRYGDICVKGEAPTGLDHVQRAYD